MPMPTKALTLRRPWPHCIFRLGKRIENRPQRTVANVGTTIAIHAGRGADDVGASEAWARARHLDRLPDALSTPGAHPCGIVGAARIIDCVAPELVALKYPLFAPWHDGQSFAWILGEVVEFLNPIPARGSLGFWRIPEHKLGKVHGEAFLARQFQRAAAWNAGMDSAGCLVEVDGEGARAAVPPAFVRPDGLASVWVRGMREPVALNRISRRWKPARVVMASAVASQGSAVASQGSAVASQGGAVASQGGAVASQGSAVASQGGAVASQQKGYLHD